MGAKYLAFPYIIIWSLAAKVNFSAEGEANFMCPYMLEEAKKSLFQASNPVSPQSTLTDAYDY